MSVFVVFYKVCFTTTKHGCNSVEYFCFSALFQEKTKSLFFSCSTEYNNYYICCLSVVSVNISAMSVHTIATRLESRTSNNVKTPITSPF